MPKHTPGPWKVKKCPCGHIGCRTYMIEPAGSFNQGSGFSEADAQLVAQSPTMFNFVDSIANLTPDKWDREDENIETHLDMLKVDIERAKKIIAKVEDKQ